VGYCRAGTFPQRGRHVNDQSPSGDRAAETPEIDPTAAHTARVYDYLLGGVTNFEADRQAAAAAGAAVGGIEVAMASVRSNRVFLGQAIRYLAAEAGIRQFLDVGTGIPNADNVHAVALDVAPDAHIVYVDNDPIVLAHARALLLSSSAGATAYLDADLYDADNILRQAADVLDFSQPIALILLNILGHVPDWATAKSISSNLVAALPSGSYLVASDATNVIDGAALDAAARIWNENANPKYHLRKPEQIEELFAGLELLEPGVVSCPLWRPAAAEVPRPVPVDQFGGVGRKP
jgi:hypothetical protein